MRVAFRVLAICLFVAAPPQLQFAQSEAGKLSAEPTTCLESSAGWALPTPGAPFVAAWKSTSGTKHTDGTIEPNDWWGTNARDSAGRMYYKSQHWEVRSYLPLPQVGWKSVHLPSTSFFEIEDSKKRATAVWIGSSSPREVSVTHWPRPKDSEKFPPVPWAPAEICTDHYWDSVASLGTKTLLGIETAGVRATRMIRAGADGNAEPVTITQERWYSPDLHFTVLFVLHDPRVPDTRWEVTDLQLAEPPAALFQLPAGYTVKDQNPDPSAESSGSR